MADDITNVAVDARNSAELRMPFSAFHDAADWGRAHGALHELWRRIKPIIAETDHQREYDRLVYLVASYTLAAHDEEDLVDRVCERYWQRKQPG